MYLIKFIYGAILLSPGLFIACLLWLGMWSYRRDKKVAKLVVVIAISIYVVSSGFAAQGIVRSLESRYVPPLDVTGDVIVVLGGGATIDTPNVDGKGHLSGSAANRLLTAIELYHRLGVPILVSGGKVYSNDGDEATVDKMILKSVGIPEADIILDSQSQNTTQNAENSARILAEKGFIRPILVTSAFHMERSVLQFEKVGVKVIPFPTDYFCNVASRYDSTLFWPSAGGTQMVAMGLKEYLGILAIRWY